jgi:hypothetical protein
MLGLVSKAKDESGVVPSQAVESLLRAIGPYKQRYSLEEKLRRTMYVIIRSRQSLLMYLPDASPAPVAAS